MRDDRDFEELFRFAAAKPRNRADVYQIARRARRLRWQRRGAAALGVSVLVVSGIGVGRMAINTSTNTSPSRNVETAAKSGLDMATTSSESGYRFFDVSVQSPSSEENVAVMRFSYNWADGVSPGVRRCTFSVYSANGIEIGSTTSRLATTRQSNADVPVEVPLTTDSNPASAEIECGKRLDDPSGSYTFSDVQVSTPSEVHFSEIAMSYDAVWTGTGEVPGMAMCVFRVYDAAGNLLIEDQASFFVETSTITDGEHWIQAPEGFVGKPVSGDVTCR